MSSSPSLLARLIVVETRLGANGILRASSPDLPALSAEAPDEASLSALMPHAIREALMPAEPCIALPVGRMSGAAGTWVALPDALAALSLAA